MNQLNRHSLLVILLVAGLTPKLLGQAASDILVLEVDGMCGESCEEYIEDSLLADVAGVEAVTADADAGEVTVSFDPRVTDPSSLARAVEDCPQLRVTGSSTHELQLDRRPRRCWAESFCLIDHSVV